MPSLLHATASSVTLPASAITLQPFFLPAFATPTGTFPMALCPSSLPSPVTTISAFFSSLSSCIAFSTISMPDLSSTFSSPKRNAKPRPPAAPAPGVSLKLFPAYSSTQSAYCLIILSICAFSCSCTPFCFPKMYTQPCSVHSGLVTSHAILK